MKPLPMPIRIAAGLVVTALEEMQELPRKITELPVTAVSQALQASMRLQQRVTELAIKGDRALGALRPVPETPAWARFDEDEEDQEPRRNGRHHQGHDAVDAPRPPKVTPVRILPYPAPEADDEVEPEVSEVPVPRPPVEPPTAPGRREGAPDATVEKVAAEVSPATDASLTEAEPTEQATSEPEPETERKPAGRKASASKTTTGKNAGSRRKTDGTQDDKKADPGQDGAGEATWQGGPPGLSEYENWTLPQLRGRFRALSLDQLQQLLDWETSHRDRPAYVTMLSNRIASVTGR